MSTIFKLARLNASDYAFVTNANQELLYTAAQQYIGMANDAVMKSMTAFVDPTTTVNHTERYKLGLTGRMQRTSEESVGKPVAASGSWDVGYPLHNYAEQLKLTDVDAAYMTPADLQLHVDGIITRAANAKRHEILYRLFNNTTDSFDDRRFGSITVQPLANGDSVVFPPVEGSETEATEDHYLASGYASSAISDTNNPYKTLTDDLVHHGVNDMNDIPVAFFINPAEQAVTEALTSFIPMTPSQVNPGANTDNVLRPSRQIPGKIIGYINGQGWVSVWNWIPSGYILAVNLGAPQPLRMRIDPVETGLGGGGLQLLPIERTGVTNFNTWRLRFGLGASNRLNAAFMRLVDGSFAVPSGYA